MEITPEQYLDFDSSKMDGEVNLQAQATRQELTSRRSTAQHLSQRQSTITEMGGTGNIELESKLASLQKQLHEDRFDHYLQKIECETLAHNIAQRLVGGGAAPQVEQPSDEFEVESLNAAIRADNLDFDDLNGWCGENLDEGTILGLNALLTSGEEQVTRAAVAGMRAMRDAPEAFISRSEMSDLNQADISEAQEIYGSELTDDILTLSTMVATGRISLPEAIGTASGNPRLLDALLDGARRGFWCLPTNA